MNGRKKATRRRISPELTTTLDDAEDLITLWHGTTRSRAKTILKNGFRAEKTMDKWGREWTFFATNPRFARRHARTKAREEGDLPAIIMCSIDLNIYNIYERQAAEVYVFAHECISKDVIVDVEGMPKRQLEKLQGTKAHNIGLTDVALTFNSNIAGIAYWINSYLKLDDPHRITEDHEAVIRIRQWLDEQVDDGRFGEVPDDEILQQVQEHLPQYLVVVKE